MSNLLLVFMFLFFIIPSVIYRQYFLALSFVIYGIVFLLVEYASYFYTQATVTQHIQALIKDNSYKGYIIIGFMLLGWVCLLLHLGMRFKKG